MNLPRNRVKVLGNLAMVESGAMEVVVRALGRSFDEDPVAKRGNLVPPGRFLWLMEEDEALVRGKIASGKKDFLIPTPMADIASLG